ncbi:hypothetical protein Tcan_04416 [Toxocara canis]|uniref:Uncharacterized protein n=1 Tax=Toxocara canis TaxID=6265 RepID=A0A0B2VKL1_TOXCA|nr:hypothetical protein Tcan_04416 [Toxocara canis]
MTNSLADVFKAFNTERGFSIERTIKLDEHVAALLLFRAASSEIVELELCPGLYKLNQFTAGEEDPSRMHLSCEFIDPDGLYLLDVGSYVYVYVMAAVGQVLVKDLFGVDCFKKIDEQKGLRPFENIFSQRVHDFIRKLSIQRAMLPPVLAISETSTELKKLLSRIYQGSLNANSREVPATFTQRPLPPETASVWQKGISTETM